VPVSGTTEVTDVASGSTPFRYSSGYSKLISNVVSCSVFDSLKNDFYLAENGECHYKGDTLDDVLLEEAIAYPAGSTIKDLAIYKENDIRKLFTLYKDASNNLEIGISDLPYDTSDDDLTWLTSTVSGQFTNALTNDAFIRVADNSFAYIFADNDVHKIDGTADGGSSGTVYPNVLQFSETYQIIDAVDYKDKQPLSQRMTISPSLVLNK
jgi:hypothetical protein